MRFDLVSEFFESIAARPDVTNWAIHVATKEDNVPVGKVGSGMGESETHGNIRVSVWSSGSIVALQNSIAGLSSAAVSSSPEGASTGDTQPPSDA